MRKFVNNIAIIILVLIGISSCSNKQDSIDKQTQQRKYADIVYYNNVVDYGIVMSYYWRVRIFNNNCKQSMRTANWMYN